MTPAERGWHDFQHAYFAAPRTRKGGRIIGGVNAGAPLRAMAALLGCTPWLPVGDGTCRTCEEDK